VPDRLLSTAEVAAILGVSDRRVRQLATSRKLGMMVGKVRVYTPADVDAMRYRPPGPPRKHPA